MTSRFIAHRFIDYFVSPVHKHVVLSKMIACAPDGITVAELTDRSGFSDGTVRAFVSELRYLRYIHVCGWKRKSPFSLSPIFKLGYQEDAPRVTKVTTPLKPGPRPKALGPDPSTPPSDEQKLTEHCLALAKALVPRRSEEEAYKVNRIYLYWLARQAQTSAV
jgi:hypothetical protein